MKNHHMIGILVLLAFGCQPTGSQQGTQVPGPSTQGSHRPSGSQQAHDHSAHDHSDHDHSAHDHSAHDHSAHDHSDHDHDHSDHDHDHGHAVVPKDKPVSYRAGVEQVQQWLASPDFPSEYQSRALKIVGWLPELAAESDLPREPWLTIYQSCQSFLAHEDPSLVQWQRLLEQLSAIQHPSLSKPVFDGRDWH